MVTHILSLISLMQKDSIIGRACRLTGNLAINQSVAVKLHQKGAVSKLSETVKSKDTSAGTKHMAVRALRSVCQKSNKYLLFVFHFFVL